MASPKSAGYRQDQNLACAPYPYALPPKPASDASILEYAAYASACANEYRAIVDARGRFEDTVRSASTLARATHMLTTAIADALACGKNSLS